MIKIGTNFLYKGPLFLDSRHGIANSKSDLLNWSIPIPEGFEVYLNLENDPAWYTYNSNTEDPDPETGYFQKRLDRSYVLSEVGSVRAILANVQDSIVELQDEIRNIQVQANLTLDITSNSGKYDVNNPQVPNINWVLKNYGTNIDPSDYDEDVTIDGNPIGKVDTWTSSTSINSTTTYQIVVRYQGIIVTKEVTYTFEPYAWTKYLGTSTATSLSDITGFQEVSHQSGWGNPTATYSGTVDCSQAQDGCYVYYIIPDAAYIPSTFSMYVGGFKTTDYEVGNLVINGQNYKTIRTGYIQTGILQLRYE